MAKTINARVQNKHDIEANWNKATGFIPLAGEIIIYDADENNPKERMKIGNGVDNVNDLPFYLPSGTGGPGENSNQFGDGVAEGDYSIAGGTNDPTIIQNLVWTTDKTEPIPAEPAQAIGAASIAHGANTVTYTTGSVAIGTGAKAGAKGFYWYDYVDTVRGSGVDILECDYDPWDLPYWYITIDQDIKENGLVVFCYGPRYDEQGEYWIEDDYLKETWSLLTGYMDDEGFVSTDGGGVITGDITDNVIFFSADNFTNLDTATKYYIGSGDNAPVKSIQVARGKGVKVRLSLTQPRISYNPGEIGTLLEDGTWAQERAWSNKAQELLEGWKPIEEMEVETDYAVISFYGGIKHTNCSKVLEVFDDGYIVVDSLPNPWANGPVTTIQWDEYLIFCPARPEYGIIEAALGSFAIGLETSASGMASFAQGFGSHAAGSYAVATGLDTEAGYAAFAGGEDSKALGIESFATGCKSEAIDDQAFASGNRTKAIGKYSFSQNQRTEAIGAASHAEGCRSVASGKYSHAEGVGTAAHGMSQHTQGSYNIRDIVERTSGTYKGYSQYAHIIGNGRVGPESNPDKYRSNAYALDWEGNGYFAGDVFVKTIFFDDGIVESSKKLLTTDVIDWNATSEEDGYIKNKPSIKADSTGVGSTIENGAIDAYSNYSHAEGYRTRVIPYTMSATTNSHIDKDDNKIPILAEPDKATALHSHAEGYKSEAWGNYSHTEGSQCIAGGRYSHAEGNSTVALHRGTHSEGEHTEALGKISHAEGDNTVAKGDFQHVQGTYNIIDDTVRTSGSYKNRGQYAHIVGNGTSASKRSNAHTVDWDGNAWFKGDIYIGGTGQNDSNAKILATKDYVDSIDSKISAIKVPTKLSELGDDTAHRVVTDAEKATWNAKSNFSGDYNDLTNKPTIPSISGLATKTYVDNKVAGIVDTAPETLNTLNELATALGNDPNFATTVANQIGTKVSQDDYITFAEIDAICGATIYAASEVIL